MPTDGIKGKTWGPSTVHQRKRTDLCVPSSNVRKPTFSKSAPNLDKSRTAGMGLLVTNSTATLPTSSSHYLGKSHDDGLNTIKTTTPILYRRYNNTNNSLCNNNGNNIMNNNSPQDPLSSRGRVSKQLKRFDYYDDQSEFQNSQNVLQLTERRKAKFVSSLPRTGGNSSQYRGTGKKYSVGSIIPPSTSNGNQYDTLRDSFSYTDQEEPVYDRGFYNGIQKSVEMIFSKDYDPESEKGLSTSPSACRNSKSSSDLTMYGVKDDNEPYSSHLFGSQFRREMFLTNLDKSRNEGNNRSYNNKKSSGRLSPPPLTAPIDQRMNSNSTLEESMDSLKLTNFDQFEEHMNSVCSDQSYTMDNLSSSAIISVGDEHRKNSVTFRDNEVIQVIPIDNRTSEEQTTYSQFVIARPTRTPSFSKSDLTKSKTKRKFKSFFPKTWSSRKHSTKKTIEKHLKENQHLLSADVLDPLSRSEGPSPEPLYGSVVLTRNFCMAKKDGN